MPLGYEELKEEKLPEHFYQLLNERESLHKSQQVRKSMRNMNNDQIKIFERYASSVLKKNALEDNLRGSDSEGSFED